MCSPKQKLLHQNVLMFLAVQGYQLKGDEHWQANIEEQARARHAIIVDEVTSLVAVGALPADASMRRIILCTPASSEAGAGEEKRLVTPEREFFFF